MIEVIDIFYYCFWKFGSESVVPTQYLESDLFFCFSNLMSELKDGFLRELDQEESGLDGKCKAIEQIVRVVDPLVYHKLTSERVTT